MTITLAFNVSVLAAVLLPFTHLTPAERRGVLSRSISTWVGLVLSALIADGPRKTERAACVTSQSQRCSLLLLLTAAQRLL